MLGENIEQRGHGNIVHYDQVVNDNEMSGSRRGRTQNNSTHNSDEASWRHDELMAIGERQSGLDNPEDIDRQIENEDEFLN